MLLGIGELREVQVSEQVMRYARDALPVLEKSMSRARRDKGTRLSFNFSGGFGGLRTISPYRRTWTPPKPRPDSEPGVFWKELSAAVVQLLDARYRFDLVSVSNGRIELYWC